MLAARIAMVHFGCQVVPPSFSTNANAPGRLFEALYPRLDGPMDTRHFVEEVKESSSLFDISLTCTHADQFKHF
uniref:Uncharacterized protein n=1 Tax=Plectus sambesii TaxID=2011161 RepID=A0A914UJP6_9BILA